MEVTLIQCPVWGTYDPPLSLAQLSSCLKNQGHMISCFDINIELYLRRTENYKNTWAWEQSLFWYNSDQVKKFILDNWELIDNYIYKIVSTDAKVVCFSVSASSRLSSIELAKELKKKKKDLIIVLGGPLFFESKYIDIVLAEEVVDIIAPGEGELVLCDLINFIEEGKDIKNCSGLFFKRDGKVVNSEPRALMKNLDELPFLDFSDLPLNNYDDAVHIPFMASRGCIQQCVFCSSKSFWQGYRSMSGERIFKELEFHKKRYKIGHIDFLDLLFNGDMRSLVNFCELMSKIDLDLHWTANMVIRPEMTPEVLKKAKKAGCEHIIYGVESGSQRILNSMRKRYKIADADKVIRATHEAGITVTTNFMFGFPSETDEDFKLTLDFIKRNAKFLDRVYPSRTFCAIEESSYFHSHLEEFGVKPNPPNHLYWESADGINTYPERLRRCKIFCDLASSLGIEVGCGVQTSVELDKWHNLGNYYEFRKEYKDAIDCYLKYFELDSSNELISSKLEFFYKEIEGNRLNLSDNKDLPERLKRAVNPSNLIEKSLTKPSPEKIKKLGRDRSLVLMRTAISANSQLNDEEYQGRKIILKSSPKEFILKVNIAFNSNCIFCLGKHNYTLFNLKDFRERFEERLFFHIAHSERIILAGLGELLLLPGAKDILDYFDDNFPHVKKELSTYDSTLTPEISDRIIKSESKYTINVFLSASNSRLHKLITYKDNFYKIIRQLKYILRLRKDTSKHKVNLVFTVSTLNIKDFPNFVKLASTLGVNKVICDYGYIYTPTQKHLSCFFKQKLTNQVFMQVEEIADKLGLSLTLPPKFGLDNYSRQNICRMPWSRIMLNHEGYIPPCEELESCYETFRNSNKWFFDIWNGRYYQSLRKSFVEGTAPCFKYCFRANAQATNDFHSHVIRRGSEKEDEDIYRNIMGR